MTLKTIEEVTNILSTRLLFRDGLAIEKIADAFTQDRQAIATALLTALAREKLDLSLGSNQYGTGYNNAIFHAETIVKNILTPTV